ncbi:MAG: hypothetical protein FJW66_00745 [Actinobacteria bacterium]|nr:hypothetical protein [Actinomycetota bacterium]
MKKIKDFLKKQGNIPVTILLVFILALAVFVTVSIMNFTHRINNYQEDLSKLASDFSYISGNLNEKLVKQSSAELLMNNTNRILSTVYFGTADSNIKEEAKGFTAFAIQFEEDFYLITAGHCIEMDGEKYKNFKFRANNKNSWIKPELLVFENDYENNRDYAVFYNKNLISMGLIPASPGEDFTPQYVLGNTERDLNLIKRYKDAVEGESGSPILNSRCHVIGLMIKKGGDYTPIEFILEAIAKINENQS